MSRFVLQGDVAQNSFDWGDIGWRCTPALTGATMFTVMDVTLGPGMAHDFHKHPDQDEMIIVKAGRVEQWIERDSRQLGPGDSVYLDAGVVHGSFNVGSEAAQLQVILGPSVGEGGYELVDMSGEEPWSGLRG